MAELSSAYLTRQLIAYIGNKRRLLKSLNGVFSHLEAEHKITTMLDPFCGSGSVSRLGKYRGYRVFANDWEEYSRIINSCHLELSPAEGEALFSSLGGIKKTLSRLNSLAEKPEYPYFSRYYAPENTQTADYRRERLFYTRENGLFLDRVREEIETLFPEAVCPGDPKSCQAKNLLLAMLLYEAATHANTSGVFKACHKGFGGHGGDALTRIMAPMELEYPVLIDGIPGEVGSMDAAAWCAGRPADLCYLDPPYNIHQYGSNYHMLNSVARWDRPEVSGELDDTGVLKNKAGIRQDWQETRSPFCRKHSAPAALSNLLQAVDARYIVLSYNSDGVVPFDQLMDMLSKLGRVELFAENYTQYRGGRQGLTRANLTTEFQLVVRRGLEHRASDQSAVIRYLASRRIVMLLKNGLHPGRLAEKGYGGEGVILAGQQHIALIGGIIPVKEDVTNLDLSEFDDHALFRLRDDLSYCCFTDNQEESEVLLHYLESVDIPGEKKDAALLLRRFLVVLRKLAHKKYRDIFESLLHKARTVDGLYSLDKKFSEKLSAIEETAEKRFKG